MRKNLYLLTIIALCLGACKKEKVPERTVGINGIFYPTVLLGDKTWTAVNYRGPGGVDVANNNTDYGKLYSGDEAMQVTLPKGWRVPKITDYYQLMMLTGTGDPYQGYKMVQSQLVTLMATTGWSVINGNNSTGFNMFPAGYSVQTTGGMVWQDAKNIALFLTSNTGTTGGSYFSMMFGFKPDGTVVAGTSTVLATVNDRGSLRFVKDN